MTPYEYKTVAMPAVISVRRRRRQSEADLVAEQLGALIAEEAVEGWEYYRSETLSTPERKGVFGKVEAATYTVLIFRRTPEAVWRAEDEEGAAVAKTTDPAPGTAARPAAAPPEPTPEIPASPAERAPDPEAPRPTPEPATPRIRSVQVAAPLPAPGRAAAGETVKQDVAKEEPDARAAAPILGSARD